jgi:hypothetical protein
MVSLADALPVASEVKGFIFPLVSRQRQADAMRSYRQPVSE